MAAIVEIYATSFCRHCVAARELLDSRKIKYTEYLLDLYPLEKNRMWTATLVTSLALHLVTFGLAAPLTYAGLTAGGLLCASGVGLFAGGFQKGVAKKITQFEEASQTIYRGSYADFASEAVRSGQPEPSCPEFEENENLPPPYESNTEQDDLLAHCFKK